MYIPILSYFKPPEFEPLGPPDIALFLAAYGIAILGLTTPFTPGWRIFRAAVCAPLTSVLLIYWAYYTTFDSYMDQCGSITICGFYTILALQHFVFFPAEKYSFRVRPKDSIKLTLSPKTASSLGGGAPTQSTGMELEAEPIPPPWTWAKLGWAASLWCSWRGVGWNFSPPLPLAASKDPFLQTSTRTRWLVNRLKHYIPSMLIYDAFRAYMNCDPAARRFFTHHTPSYSGLTQWQRATYSTAAAFRMFLNLEKTYVPASMFFVGLGGLLGWESEFFSPWGWPPLFANLSDVWKYPGLSVAWSRLWHQWFRSWLYKFGWVGIGENILGLPRSGPDPKYPLASTSAWAVTPALGPSPQASGRTSPTHPLPPSPATRSGLAMTNLIKSICVFTLTGLIHDYGYYFLQFHVHANDPSFWKTRHWTDAISSTRFFVSQPFGIAVEAVVKKAWRRWKARSHPEWRAQEPDWLIFAERLIGFVWTWTFLGWTAGWYVEGIARDGYYRRDETQKLFPSLMGGLMYGKWHH